MSIFFNLFRKKGTIITLNILSKANEHQMLHSEFIKKLKKCKNDLNAYFRIKKDLLKYKIISIKLNQNAKKIIFLTDLGKKISNYIKDIEFNLLNAVGNNPD
ncbi:MAG: hypothetical protein ACTSRZ_19345 [Promethearchaeota archaeon]